MSINALDEFLDQARRGALFTPSTLRNFEVALAALHRSIEGGKKRARITLDDLARLMRRYQRDRSTTDRTRDEYVRRIVVIADLRHEHRATGSVTFRRSRELKGSAPEAIIRHHFPLRHDLDIVVSLPCDLTMAEAERLEHWLLSLAIPRPG